MKLRSEVMLCGIPSLCLLLTLALGPRPGGAESVCERGKSWWDRRLGACVPCTRCDPSRLALRYPCELHRDTICQSLYEIPIWPFNTNNNDSFPSDYEYYEYPENSELSDKSAQSEVLWDLQTSTLTLAACGCVIFFAVVLSLSLYHAKQWKVLKKALQSDVQDLSAKLRLMESGGEAPSQSGVIAADHHIYCNIQVTKDGFDHLETKKGFGNVYTQEKHAT